MNLLPINKNQFSQWREMRKRVYSSLDDEFHEIEMKKIVDNRDWFCYFLENDNNKILGMVELSSRNIVDGCLSSPVAYLEGLYLKKQHRGMGLGREAIEIIKNWCKKKGFTELGMDTEMKNVEAQKFFKAIGLHETYRIVQYRVEVD